MKFLLTLITILTFALGAFGQNLSSTDSITITADSDSSGNDGSTTIEVKPGISGFKLNYDKTVTIFGNRMLLGDSTIAAASRLELATKSTSVGSLGMTTYDTGTYKNHVMNLGFNQDSDGNKIVVGAVDTGLRIESQWLSGSGYQTELYFTWRSPDGSISNRPWSMDILHSTGQVTGSMRGRWVFVSDSGSSTASWLNEGLLDFYTAQGGIRFRNNSNAIRAYNASLTGDVNLLKFDDQNRVVVSADSAPILLSGPTEVENIYYTGKVYKRGDADVQILGKQCANFALSSGGTDNQRAINDVINCMLDHGLIAKPLM